MNEIKTYKYGAEKEILRHRKFTAVPVTIDAASVEADAQGRKIMKAGTILGGKTTPILEAQAGLVVEKNDADAEGVLRYDVDLLQTTGASMVIRGDIKAEKLPEPVSDEAKEALKSRILFVKS